MDLAGSIEVLPAPFLLELLFGLVAESGAAGRTHGAADDRAWRTGDRAAHHGACGHAAQRTSAGSGLVIGSLGGLTRDGTADRADGAADDRTGGTSEGGPDGRAAKGTGSGADGLAADLVLVVRVEPIGVPVDTCGVARSIHGSRLLGLVWGS
jgi:hypothetical protein